MGSGLPDFPQGSTCLAVLWILLSSLPISCTGLSPPMACLSSTVPLSSARYVAVRNPGKLAFRFGLFPFRSPLLWKSMSLSLPPATWMFRFTGFPSAPYIFRCGWQRASLPGFPIRISVDRWLFAPPRGFSQLVASFFGSQCQGIHPTLLFVDQLPLSTCFGPGPGPK